jgi:Ca2+-transporting ATPase
MNNAKSPHEIIKSKDELTNIKDNQGSSMVDANQQTNVLEYGGLAGAEAARRLAADGPNILPGSEPQSSLAMIVKVLTEPMFLMLLAAGGIYLALGSRTEAILLLSFVFVVIGMTLLEQRRTQRALESLRDLSAPRALVIRDNKELRIAARELVRGDLMVLREGDRIAADARLLQGNLSVNESLLTGEAVPVQKTAQAAVNKTDQKVPATSNIEMDRDKPSALFASTVVTSGLGQAEVIATATGTAVGKIGKDLASTKEPPSALQQASGKLVRWLGLMAVLIAGCQIILAWWWNGQPILASLLSGIALAMAILPEEIPVILTVFLAMGAWRIAQHKVLTRRVSAVESLGAITVLAVDKTGTLTQNRMQVAELATQSLTDTGEIFNPVDADELPEAFHALTEFAMLATPGDPFDPMEKAIDEFSQRWLAGTEHVRAGREAEFEYPLTADILAMTKVFTSKKQNQHVLAAKGAPEAIADLCHLNPQQRAVMQQQIKAMAERGLRVLGVARGTWLASKDSEPDWPNTQHDFDFTFLGLLALADPPRPEVPEAIAQCRRAGVRVIMMTGDHSATARAIAKKVGLSERAEVISGAEMTNLDDATLLERLAKVDICARLQPEHKLRLVNILREQGEVVAMTGDGVNDAPALKAADIGIAMGERGTDVAREAAALVLLDDSFLRIVSAIGQGRRIYDNIRKATRFTFAVHVPIIALALVPVILHWPALLLPVHIVLLELIINPACSIIFEAEPQSSQVMERPPRQASDSPFSFKHLLNGMLQGLGVAAILLTAYAWMTSQAWDVDQSVSLTVLMLVISVYLLILANRDLSRAAIMGLFSKNKWVLRMAAVIAVLLSAFLLIPWLSDLVGMTLPTAKDLVVACIVLGLMLLWLEVIRRIGPAH